MGKKKIEKKIYKANTQLLRKILIGLIILFFITILAIPLKNGITYLYLKTWEWHDISKYHLEVKLPRAYKPIEEKNTTSSIGSSLISTETSVKVNEKYVMNKPDVVYSGGNILNGISLMIQCLNTEKTTRTLDDIADSQHTLVRIFYEDEYTISEPVKEYLKILGTDSIRTSTILTNHKETKKMINYLVPLEDKEVTITFLGPTENVEQAEDEIEKIVSQMKNK